MPDQGVSLHRVHGFVRGVNWRATKFAAPVPSHFTCALCHVIPRATFLLPCHDVLCESCVNPSLNDGNIACPFHKEAFATGECQKVHLQGAAADRLKACCWNEANGCTFVSTLQAVLTHYEEECTFHTVTCQRCNDRVLHQDLPRHFASGCHMESIPTAAGAPTLSQNVVVSAEDMRACIDELKALIRDPYQDRLPALQSNVNELLEEARAFRMQVEAMYSDSTQSEQRITQAVQELQSQQSALYSQLTAISEREARSAGEAGSTSANGMPWKLEKRHILRKLELMIGDSLAYMELLRISADQQLERTVVEYNRALDDVNKTIVPPPLLLKYETEQERYIVRLTNIDDVVKSGQLVFLFTQWYRRDRYLQVATYGWEVPSRVLIICLKWGTTALACSSTTPRAFIYVLHSGQPKTDILRLEKVDVTSRAQQFGFQDTFEVNLSEVERLGLFNHNNGKLRLFVSFKV